MQQATTISSLASANELVQYATNTVADSTRDVSAHYVEQAKYLSQLEFVVHGVCITSVGLAGLAANVVCLLVLRQPALKCGRQGSVNVILTSMAAIDFLLLLCAILMFGLPGITQYLTTQYQNSFINSTHNVLSYLLPWVYSVGMVAQTASVYLTVTVTIERYLAVCFPFMARTFCTRGRARKAVLVVIFFSLFYNSTRFFEYRALYKGEHGEVCLVEATPLRLDPIYEKVYIMVMYMLVMYAVPFLLLLVLNIRIGIEIRSARLRRHSIIACRRTSNGVKTPNSCSFRAPSQSNEHQNAGCQTDSAGQLLNGSKRTRERLEENEQQNLAIMLMVVVMIFVLCNVLAMVSNILDALQFDAAAITKVSNLLVTLNSSVNLFIYCGFGKKFRRELKKLFHLVDASRNEHNTILRRHWKRPGENDSMFCGANDNINSNCGGGVANRREVSTSCRTTAGQIREPIFASSGHGGGTTPTLLTAVVPRTLGLSAMSSSISLHTEKTSPIETDVCVIANPIQKN